MASSDSLRANRRTFVHVVAGVRLTHGSHNPHAGGRPWIAVPMTTRGSRMDGRAKRQTFVWNLF